MSGHTPPVSIIIPAHNEAGRLAQCLESAIPAARERGWEVVVVDDGSTDGTADVAKALGARLVRHLKPRGAAATRNAGAREAAGAILLFLDADIVAPASTLYALVDRLNSDPRACATGAVASPEDLSRSWSAHFVGLRAAWATECLHGKDVEGFSAFQSECGAIHRHVFEALGGFQERYDAVGMEEYALGHDLEQQGYLNVLLAGAPYRHHYKPLGRRCRELLRRAGRWVPLLLKRRKMESSAAVGTPGEALSCVLSNLLLLSLIAGFFLPAMWLVALVATLAQLIIERSFFAFAHKHHGVRMVVYAWPALHVYHAAVAIGIAWGVLRVFVHLWPVRRSR